MEEDLEGENPGNPIVARNKNVIKPIDTGVTHRICSGQVIVTLSIAIKELVENSLDAGATSIEIRLVESGSKLIEVKDNGRGVEESNFANLARKHHTSKLSQFEDLESIGTFGFRGEALSALSALSESLTVITRNQESKQGYKIDYNQQGEIVSQSIVARQIGTTVTLRNVFSPLAVRHKEFLKNLKREFHRMVTVLYGYSIVTSGVRISCRNEVNGNSSHVLRVPPSETAKERIASIFGNKQVTSLIDIEDEEEIEESILAEFDLARAVFKESQFRLTGLISGPNSGRSSTDRQFYYVNDRPCDSHKISRLVNEVYHMFSSRSQYPFIYLNVRTRQENVDVNVTPDKRSLFLQNEKVLYALIKGTIIKTLSKASSNFSPSRTSASLQKTLKLCSIPAASGSGSDGEEVEMDESDKGTPASANADDSKVVTTLSPPSITTGFDPQFSSHSTTAAAPHLPKTLESRKTVRSYLTKFKFGNSLSESKGTAMSLSKRPSPTALPCGVWRKPKPKQLKLMDFVFSKTKQTLTTSSPTPSREETEEDDDIQILDTVDVHSSGVAFAGIDSQRTVSDDADDEGCSILSLSQISATHNSEEVLEVYSEDYCDAADDREPLGSLTLSLNWASVLSNSSRVKERLSSFYRGPAERIGIKFRAKISPDDNSSAESELKKSISKEMFKEMRLIGQFNLGFLITKFGSDLFIVDQHAADEKFNYENLEKTTVLQGQRLIMYNPMALQLPAVSENILMENLSVFEKNGFSFHIKRRAEPTKRVSLTKIPYSKSCQFGKQDVEELIYLLEDAPEKSFYRPMKVRTMLASRACRKSVMIGDKLSLKDMRRVVGQLADIEQPWNCPHGRPTLRHLFNLDLLPDANWLL